MSEAYIIDAIRTPRGKGKKTAHFMKLNRSVCSPDYSTNYSIVISLILLKLMILFWAV